MIDISKISGRMGNQMFKEAYLFSQVKKGLLPDTYLQDPKYFQDAEEGVKNLFQEGIGFLPYVSIHIRRGDYVNNPFYVHLEETDYYDRAIEKFPDDNFLVFSDDVSYTQELFSTGRLRAYKDRVQVMEGTELEDFNMMSSCKANIIANSSFSWWAAYVNPNPGKTVIAPQHWYTDGIDRTVCPPEWLRL